MHCRDGKRAKTKPAQRDVAPALLTNKEKETIIFLELFLLKNLKSRKCSGA
jgi:hypothetical protein